MASEATPQQQLADALADGVARIQAAATSDELKTVLAGLTGKKGSFVAIRSSLGKVALEITLQDMCAFFLLR